MSLPSRMNLTSVKIRQIRTAAQLVADADFEQARSGDEYGAEMTLRCQVYYNSFGRLSPTRTGDAEAASGRLVFSRRYLVTKGVTLKKGDKITAVTDRGTTFTTVAFRLIDVQPSGHLPNPGLMVAFFEHDQENRQSP